MNDKKPLKFDFLRVNYGRQKLCQCREPRYEVDVQNRLVTCRICNAVVEPFEALKTLAIQYEREERVRAAMVAEMKAVAGYSPKRKVIKQLESQYSRKDPEMLPTCPHCAQPFDLEDLVRGVWVNKKYVFPKKPEGE